jgi:hypothetical protein
MVKLTLGVHLVAGGKLFGAASGRDARAEVQLPSANTYGRETPDIWVTNRLVLREYRLRSIKPVVVFIGRGIVTETEVEACRLSQETCRHMLASKGIKWNET